MQSSNSDFKFRSRNVKQLVQVSSSNEHFKIKENLKELHVIENGTIIISNDGLIHDIGPTSELEHKYQGKTFETDLDCTDKCIIPGLVDAHTHPVWSGDRCHEWIMKLEGKSYMEIHKAGGGIGFTVEHTKKSSEEELLKLFLERLDRMARLGTTLVEAKSGYGLEKDTEIKMLKVIKQAKSKHALEIVSNYLGAHSIPKGMKEDEATEDVIKNQIPALKEMIDKGEIDPELIDVFCEKGVFERENTRRILEAGKAIGLKANFHGDEINYIDSGTLGAEVGALAISHLENLDDKGIEAMAKNNIAGVLLPTTHHLLKLKDPPARKMIEQGVIVALGSDFNPNAFCLSMPLTMNFACVNLKMMPSESLVASTLNSAYSMGRSKTHGSLEKGKVGDLVVVNAPKWEHIIYEMADSPIKYVVKKGNVIFTNQYL